MPTAVVTLEEGLQAKTSIRDFELLADEPVDEGGLDMGPKPTELLLSAIGSCVAITMKLYAQRKGWDLAKVQVTLDLEKLDPAQFPQQAAGANVLHRIRKQYVIEGNLTDEQKTRLVEIGGKCPVARLVQNPVIFEDSLLAPTQP